MLRFRWQLAAFLLGGLFFFLVLRNFGFASLAALLRDAGSWSFLAFFFYPLMTLPDVAAWKLCFSNELSPRVFFFRLILIRLAGEALNNITPFIDIGGEPLKIKYAHQAFGVPISGAASATVVARTSLLISQAFFMLFGVVMSYAFIPLEPRYQMALIFTLLLIWVAFTAFIYLQQKDWLKKINPEISRYYAMHHRRFWAAVPFNVLGWTLGGVETYFFCRILHMDISVLDALMLEALLQLIRTGSFFIPGNLGAQEGGLAFFIGQMGFEPVLGVGLSLLKRFRQIAWTVVGFLVWAVFKYYPMRNARNESP